MSIEKILEILGIDLIPYAIGISKFKSDAPFEPVKLMEIGARVQDLDAKKLDDALKFSKELLDEESTRGEKTEGNAFNLIGVTGIAAAFITGISSLLPKEVQTSFYPFLGLLLVFYLLTVISLTLTVLLASKVIMVRGYTYPDISDVFKMSSQSLVETKKDRLTSYMYSYAKNCQTNNVKVSYLMGAQLWFRNSIIIFLALAFVLVPNFLGEITSNNQSSPTQIPTLVFTLQPTQTVFSVTETQVLPTNTIHPISITKTPTLVQFATVSFTEISVTPTVTP